MCTVDLEISPKVIVIHQLVGSYKTQLTCTPSYPACQHRYAVSPNLFTISLISGIVNALPRPSKSASAFCALAHSYIIPLPNPTGQAQAKYSPRFRKLIPRPPPHQLHLTRAHGPRIQPLSPPVGPDGSAAL